MPAYFVLRSWFQIPPPPAEAIQPSPWDALPEELKLQVMQFATSGPDKLENKKTHAALRATDKNTRRIAQDESFVREDLLTDGE